MPNRTPEPTAAVTMTPTEILQAARDLIADKEKWTTGAFAREPISWADDLFGPCLPTDPAACKWCLIGATILCTPKGLRPGSSIMYEPIRVLLNAANHKSQRTSQQYTFNWIADVNDRGGHAEALALLDRAIALSKLPELPKEITEIPEDSL